MSNVFIQAIHSRLSGDSTLTNNLLTYATVPAIFAGGQIPSDVKTGASNAFIMIHEPLSDVEESISKTEAFRRISYDIQAVQTNDPGNTTNYNQSLLYTICERVRILLHRYEMTISGHQQLVALCTGPYGKLTDEQYSSLTVTLTIMIREN